MKSIFERMQTFIASLCQKKTWHLLTALTKVIISVGPQLTFDEGALKHAFLNLESLSLKQPTMEVREVHTSCLVIFAV